MEFTSPLRQEKSGEDRLAPPLSFPVPVVDAHQLAEARNEASKRGVSVISILEETCGGEPDHLVAELGRLLRMPVLTMENLRSAAPAFEILSFSEAISKECVLLHQ